MRAPLIYLAISSVLGVQPAIAGLGRRLSRGFPSLPGLGRVNSLGSSVPDDLGGELESVPLNDQQSGAGSDLPLCGNATFEQYIDHNDHEVGTFTQHYAYNASYWKPGGPIIIFTTGEGRVDHGWRYGTEEFLTGMLAKEVGGAVVVLETRYFGQSTLFDGVYTAEKMKYLTLDQVMADFRRVTCELKLPFDPTGSSNRPRAPWIIAGGSFGAALAVWAERFASGTFWAVHASSAAVQGIYGNWQMTVPMQEHMPRNCSADWSRIFNHIDDVYYHGTEDQQHDLKAMFGMQTLKHYDDFADAVATFIGLWEDIQPYEDASGFYKLCDIIEGLPLDQLDQDPPYANFTAPSETGVGLEKALAGYSDLWREYVLPGYCSSYGYPEWTAQNETACWDTYAADSPIFVATVNNSYERAWDWIVCTWPVYVATAAQPHDWNGPLLWPRASGGAENLRRKCSHWFPADDNGTYADGSAAEAEASVAAFNALTGGWDYPGTSRVFQVSGEHDGWREICVASDFRPGGRFQGTKDIPSIVLKDGFHCSDLVAKSGQVNADIRAAQDTIIAQHKQWILEFYDAK